MQLTTFLLSLFLAFTVSAAPLLTKRQGVYNIDGEPTTFLLAHDKKGKIIPPADFPKYDSLDRQCEAHKNYVARMGVDRWKQECPGKILQWKIDNNVFESRELAAEAKEEVERRKQREEERRQIEEQRRQVEKQEEEQRRQIQAQKLQDMFRECKRKPEASWCRMWLSQDARMMKEKEAQGGDGVKEVVA